MFEAFSNTIPSQLGGSFEQGDICKDTTGDAVLDPVWQRVSRVLKYLPVSIQVSWNWYCWSSRALVAEFVLGYRFQRG